MTGLTKRCPDCKGEGGFVVAYPEIGMHPEECRRCDATGRVPILETELEAHGQERLPL